MSKQEIMEKELTVIEARDLLKSDQNAQIIDVRSNEAYEKNSISGTINIPLKNLSQEIPKLDGKKLTLVICDDGLLSQQAKALLEACSFKVQIIRGGLRDWKRIINPAL